MTFPRVFGMPGEFHLRPPALRPAEAASAELQGVHFEHVKKELGEIKSPFSMNKGREYFL